MKELEMRGGALAALTGCLLIAGFASPGLAVPIGPSSSLHDFGGHQALQVKKKQCVKIFDCEYYAPASYCSNPPCCKKGHWEKVCDKPL